jgi:hypothetical protein
MTISPFDLNYDDIEPLRAVRDGRGILEVESDVRVFMMAWSRAEDDLSKWIAFGGSEEEAREDLNERLAALDAYEELIDECGSIPAKYRDLVEAVRAAADERGIQWADMDDVALVREWERHSETSAANWLLPDADDISRLMDHSRTAFIR